MGGVGPGRGGRGVGHGAGSVGAGEPGGSGPVSHDGPAPASAGDPGARPLTTILAYAAAALAEIGGCFAVWTWARLGGSAWWLPPGLALLALFAWLLTLAPAGHAGRAFAAYGGVYVAASLGWAWAVEGHPPDRWDLVGGALCGLGAAVVLWGPRGG